MKLNRYIWVLLSLVLLVTGCIKDTIGTPCPFGTNALLTLNMPETEAEVCSYALSEADEHRLAAVDVLVFKDNGTGADNETFVYATTPTAINNATGIYNKTIKVLFNESGTDKHRIVLLANVRDKVANFDDVIAGFTAATTKQAALNQIRFANNGVWATSGATLPMWGEMEETVVIGPNTVYTAVDMLRSLVRIDVGINMDAVGTPQGLGDLFKLTKVRAYNSNNLALTAPYAANYNFGSVVLPSIPAAPAPGKNSPIEYMSAIPTGTLGFVREIYTAEIDNKTQSNKDNRFVLIVGGYYTAPGSGTMNTTVETWYRVDFRNPLGDVLDVLRNHRYIVNIKEVNGSGQATPEEAFNQAAYLSADVIPWNEFLLNKEPEGDYTINISPSIMKLSFDEHTTESADNIVTISTNYNGEWVVEKIVELINGVEIPLTGSDAWLKTSILKGQGAEVSMDMRLLLTPNTTSAVRKARVYLKAGRWSQSIWVTQAWITCGICGVTKNQQIGSRTYQTHLFTTNYSTSKACWMVENSREIISPLYDNDAYVLKNYTGKIPVENRGYYYNMARMGRDSIPIACPKGWRLPNNVDVSALMTSVLEEMSGAPTSKGVYALNGASTWWGASTIPGYANLPAQPNIYAGSYENGTFRGWDDHTYSHWFNYHSFSLGNSRFRLWITDSFINFAVADAPDPDNTYLSVRCVQDGESLINRFD